VIKLNLKLTIFLINILNPIVFDTTDYLDKKLKFSKLSKKKKNTFIL